MLQSTVLTIEPKPIQKPIHSRTNETTRNNKIYSILALTHIRPLLGPDLHQKFMGMSIRQLSIFFSAFPHIKETSLFSEFVYICAKN